VGIEAIPAAMGQERDTLEDMVEPNLLQIGFVIRALFTFDYAQFQKDFFDLLAR